MQEPLYVALFMTASSGEEARAIAKALVGEQLVACVNIVPKIASFFWWKGKLCEEEETLLIAKTRASQFAHVVERVKALHSYEVPEVIALPLSAGSEDYLRWIDEVTGQGTV